MKKQKSVASVIVLIICIVIIVISAPFMIGIGLMLKYDSDAQRDMEYTYAATIDNSCKSYYTDIIIGKTENRDGEKDAVPLFPDGVKQNLKERNLHFLRQLVML